MRICVKFQFKEMLNMSIIQSFNVTHYKITVLGKVKTFKMKIFKLKSDIRMSLHP